MMMREALPIVALLASLGLCAAASLQAAGEAVVAGEAADAGIADEAAKAGNTGEAAEAGHAGQAAEVGHAGQAAEASHAGQAAEAGHAGQAAEAGHAGQAAEAAPAGVDPSAIHEEIFVTDDGLGDSPTNVTGVITGVEENAEDISGPYIELKTEEEIAKSYDCTAGSTDQGYKCLPYYMCSNVSNVFSFSLRESISLALKSSNCEGFLDICCKDPDFIPKKIAKKPSIDNYQVSGLTNRPTKTSTPMTPPPPTTATIKPVPTWIWT